MPPKKSLTKQSITFHVRLPVELHEWLLMKAGEAGVPVAVYLRRLIRNAMKGES
ncbi:MAG: hypothetical protein RMI43_05425 [Candidatus Caldarchaeum sp.]|nr:hypothetical protein [Candidatus Caldarchaeum sp.]MDW8063591.1 hypothetical protein [Candidatus Caldarchaeum sp.]MDW8435378.1 hypothetical protein [Candidatus Caldarchaeum sp.]